MITSALAVQPGALLATAPAALTVEQLNAELAGYRLCLPVFPLVAGLSLAALTARNAGGRRRLRYGPIGRYLRAAVLEGADGAPVAVGGPTIKRATGYGLQRALAGGDLGLGSPLELTFSLRPLPAAREARLLRCADLAAACGLGARLYAAGLALSALAVAEDEHGAGLLLAELEEQPAVVARQLRELARLTSAEGAAPLDDAGAPWARWEELAVAQEATGAGRTLDLTLPRASLPSFVAQAATAAHRYGCRVQLWGDAGVGALHLVLAAEAPAEAGAQLLTALSAMACGAGGALSSELGAIAPTPLPDLAQGPAPHTPGGLTIFQQISGYPLRAGRLKPPASLPRPAEAGSAARFSGVFQPSQRLQPPGWADLQPSAALLDALRAIVGPGYLLTRPEEVACYDLDASIARPSGAALAVALPASTDEVAALVRVAAAHNLPLVSRGAGSGLAGGSVPGPGALVLALNRLDQISVDAAQMVAHVGAGAVTAEVQRAAEAVGLFYPPDPSSQSASTIGGNLACNAGGPRCVKYGVTSDYLLGLTAVLADGRVVRWGDGLAGQGADSSLAQLLAGSEGTLGVIIEATLRLIARPPAQRTTLALFASLEAACATVEQIMAAGVVPAGMELMDDACLAAVEGYLALGLPRDAAAMLLMLADGAPEAVEAETATLAALARAGGATVVETARDAADEARLWQARRAVSIALTRIRPSRLGEDISVPLSSIAACVSRIKAAGQAHGLPIVVYGHAGDGNLHPNILFDLNDPGETARLWPCAEAIFAAALAVGGTLSGEHGIGTLKRPFMTQALSAGELAAQRRIKARLDPCGLLNPGKVLPE
jgi:glycolate oxidase subunit GlcD